MCRDTAAYSKTQAHTDEDHQIGDGLSGRTKTLFEKQWVFGSGGYLLRCSYPDEGIRVSIV